MATFISHSPSETEALGEAWAVEARPGWVIGLSGGLGAGKTQLTRGLARGLGCASRVHSPTFALVNEYHGGRCALHHLDLYRLAGPDEIIRAGLEIYLTRPDGIAVVEWIERWEPGVIALGRRVRILCPSETEREIQYEDFGH
ncbi:MAG TPA: tRNA (adenosine(37)-N6)-threonylcarbamoyltransferase complex ATPase subunit type 1 TsaE [Verrucomicrobiae bacterium]|jgi:tRNA threonylcarbamoyladenosine biosynthesis protein TsaE|nr:tRNA (adenosine(37)-N6)-threonylcarbamoyltransferase complex ATPase subunit type 1 TsaE [Verrucomicrobiae bacterium]